jgi:SHAQKYF class myb-like DNA-binding protein
MSSCGGREGVARHYVRSKVPCLRWTSELHRCYACVIETLGGHQKATPKFVIIDLKDVKGKQFHMSRAICRCIGV